MEILDAEVKTCTKCELHKGRKNAVLGEGPADAKIMFVGEGPGQNEDEQGKPFVGSAGRLLTELLESIGLKRTDVYITNIVKCRPPNNRAPKKLEVETCNPYLAEQIRLIKPRIICPLGTPAITTILGVEYSATKSHGQLARRDGRMIFPMYHPAAALYDASLKHILASDFGTLKTLLYAETNSGHQLSSDSDEIKRTLEKWA